MEEPNNMPKNFLQICRLCLGNELLEDIFSHDGLHVWISNYLSIMVNIDDQISKSICFCCRTRLQEFRNFQQQCVEVQNVLLKQITTIFHQQVSNSKPDEAEPVDTENWIKCNVCSKPCRDAGELKRHERTHIRKFVCQVCDKAYHRPIRLRRHLESHHPEVFKEKPTETNSDNEEPKENQDNGQKTSIESNELPHSTVETIKREELIIEDIGVEEQDQEAIVESLPCDLNNSTEPVTTIKQEKIEEDIEVEQPPNDLDSSIVENIKQEPIAELECMDTFGEPSEAESEMVPSSITESIKVEELIIEDVELDQEDDTSDISANVADQTDVNDKRETCEICGKKFRNKNGYYAHKYTVHGPRVHICPICGKGFVSRSRLAAHEKHHKPKEHPKLNEPMDPTITPKVESNIDDELAEANTIIPPAEDSTTGMSMYATSEVVPADSERPFWCEICNKSYVSIKLLKEHRRNIHGPKKHKCSICSTAFTMKEGLLRHMMSHNKEKRSNIFAMLIQNEETFDEPVHGPRCHQCPFCEESFVQVRQLDAHKANEHKNEKKIVEKPMKSKLVTVSQGDETSQMFQCSQCSKMFPTRKQLFDHRNRAHRPKKYACPICGKTFVGQPEMYLHARSHNVVRKKLVIFNGPDGTYQCGVCMKTFRSKRSLTAHQKLHRAKNNADAATVEDN